MWLARSLPPFLSHLRRPGSAHRGSLLMDRSSARAYTSSDDDNFNCDPSHRSMAVAAGALASSKRPDFCGGCGSNQLLQRQRHLYLALDDWKHGFSIHKLSLDDLLGGGDGCDLQRLPEPLFRLGFLTVGSYPCFHAVGSSIVVTSHLDRFGGGMFSTVEHDDGDGRGLTLVYDTETGAMDMENSLPVELRDGSYPNPTVAAAGGSLYMFDSGNDGGLPYLCPTESTISHLDSSCFSAGEEFEPYCTRPQRRWVWERSPAPPPFSRNAEDESSLVSATALHPDGRTVFVSVRSSWLELDEKEKPQETKLGTFSLDTETGKWTRHGDWYLPFQGEARYDDDLDAWVGTRMVRSTTDGRRYENEHLCSCDVPAIGDDDGGGLEETAAPVCKVDPEELTFLEEPLEATGKRVLLHAGGGMFCLVEAALREGVRYSRRLGGGDKWLLHVTMFRAKYGKNGELLAEPITPGRSYIMSRYLLNFNASAFWI